MKAFILAAGFGSRLKPLTTYTPKPLIPVLNVPPICYSLALLKNAGIRRVICNVHYHAGQIREFLSANNSFGMDIHISEEREILGTGGGLKRCESLLDDAPFLLLNSDIIADFDLHALISQHERSGNAGTLMLFETPSARKIGDVGIHRDKAVDFRNMLNSGFRSDYLYAGAALLDPSIFRYLSSAFSSIVDTGFTGCISDNSLGFFRHAGFWQDIGTPRALLDANIRYRKPIMEHFQTMNTLLGTAPHLLPEDLLIARGARMSESVIGHGCRIGENSVIDHSILLPGSVIAKNTVIREQIIFPEGTLSVG